MYGTRLFASRGSGGGEPSLLTSSSWWGGEIGGMEREGAARAGSY